MNKESSMKTFGQKGLKLCVVVVVVVLATAPLVASADMIVVPILSGWVHLGDQTLQEHAPYGGATATGTNWQTTFNLPSIPSQATLSLGYGGTSYNSPIRINDVFLDYLPIKPNFPVEYADLDVPISMLQAGPNTIRIYPGKSGSNYDDISFGEISITVPEPATLSLLTLGGLAVLRRRRK